MQRRCPTGVKKSSDNVTPSLARTACPFNVMLLTFNIRGTWSGKMTEAEETKFERTSVGIRVGGNTGGLQFVLLCCASPAYTFHFTSLPRWRCTRFGKDLSDDFFIESQRVFARRRSVACAHCRQPRLRRDATVVIAAIIAWRLVIDRTTSGIVEHAVRQDPVLPKNVTRHDWSDRLERVKSADTHLVDDEKGREGNDAWRSCMSRVIALPWNC